MFHVKQAGERGAGSGDVKKPAGGIPRRAEVASIVMFIVPTLDAGKGRGVMGAWGPRAGLHGRGVVGVGVGIRPEVV